MQIGGIGWWLLVGMFGWGAAVGLLISLCVTKWLIQPHPGEGREPLFQLFQGGFFVLAGIVVIPLTGIVGVVLAFVAHRFGWEKPLPYLAGIGVVFLLLLASWILWTLYGPSSTRRHKGGSSG